MSTVADITIKVHFSDLEAGVDDFVSTLIDKVSQHFAGFAIDSDGDTCQIVVERSDPPPKTPPPSRVVTYTVNENGRVSSRTT